MEKSGDAGKQLSEARKLVASLEMKLQVQTAEAEKKLAAEQAKAAKQLQDKV